MRALVVLAAALAAVGCRPAPYLVLVDPQEPLDPSLVEGCFRNDLLDASDVEPCLLVGGSYYVCGDALGGAAMDCVVDAAGSRHVVTAVLADELWAGVGWTRCEQGPERGRLIALPLCTTP
jgi:hypothetical protein